MKKQIILFLLYSMLLCCAGLSAQNIRSESDKKQYNIGDVIELKFRVPFVQGEHQKLINEFPNTDSLELQATLTDTLKEAGKTFLQYSRRYMSFIPGVRNVGDSLYVRCESKSGEKVYKILPTQIEVLQYPIDTAKTEIKDIKSQIEEPFSIKEVLPLIYAILVIAALTVGMYFVMRYLKNRPVETVEQKKPEIYVAPHIIALQNLEDLRLKRLSEQGLKKQYYSELCEILWTYLEGRFTISAHEMTTQQIDEQMKHCSEIDNENFAKAHKLFATADLVKFAKYQPDQITDQNMWNLAIGFVNNTKQVENPQNPQ